MLRSAAFSTLVKADLQVGLAWHAGCQSIAGRGDLQLRFGAKLSDCAVRCRFQAGPFDYRKEDMDTMKMYTYVNFSGKCAEAFRFYEKHLGGKVGMMMTHGQAPDQSKVNPEWKDAVLHARISVGGTELMGADIPNAEPMRSAYLSLSVESDAEAERIFSALSDEGEVFMPIQETFFATRFGQLRDRFGLNWMILHERPMPTGA